MDSRRHCVASVWLVLLAGCSSTPSGPASANDPLDISNVLYAGNATDEALLRLLDATAKDDAQHRAVVDSPDLGAPLSKDSPATLAFHLSTPLTSLPGQPLRQPLREPSAWQRPLREMLRLLGPPRVAHAHGAPYNGTAYLLVITDARSQRKLRVFTGQASYTPEPDTWQSLAQAAQPLSLKITSAFYEQNEIPEDGGPFTGGTFEFRIE